MQALHLDWQAGPRHVTPVGVALALAALLCVAWVALDYQQADAEGQSLQARQARPTRATQTGKSRTAAAGAAVGAAPLAREDAQSAAQIDAQLQRPWDALLHAVEQAGVKDVALISLDVQAAAGSVHVVADAKSIEQALAFVNKLRQSPALKKVYLSGQEDKLSGTQKVLRFSLDASWSEAP